VSDRDDGGIPHSPAGEFGHCRDGYAVEFNYSGFACRTLTVETRDEAEMIRPIIGAQDETSGVRVVRDD